MGKPVMTAERVIAHVRGQLQGLVGTARPLTARQIKQELRELLDWIEAASAPGAVEAVFVETGGTTPAVGESVRDFLETLVPDPEENMAPARREDAVRRDAGNELDGPAEEWLVEAFRAGYLKVLGDGRAQYQEWAHLCTLNDAPCIVVREGDSSLGPASVGFDNRVLSGRDSSVWEQAVALFNQAAAKTESKDVFVVESLYGLFGSVAEAEALARALVGLLVKRRHDRDDVGAGEP